MLLNPKLKTFHFVCRSIACLVLLALICFTAIPLLRSDAWWVRIFDFPRIQIAVLIVITLTGYAALHFWQKLRPWEYVFTGIGGLALIWQLISIAPYTAIYPKEMSDSRN